MSINIATLTPAILKAKEVATQQYVDDIVGAIDVSSDINANNNVLALDMGFSSYAAMKAAYVSLGQTIISGGHINTNLIDANALNITGTDGSSSVTVNKDGIKVIVNGITRVKIGKIS